VRILPLARKPISRPKQQKLSYASAASSVTAEVQIQVRIRMNQNEKKGKALEV
jgi:hypothetical protein